MATLTVSIPNELKQKLDARPEVDWSNYIRIKLLGFAQDMEKFTKK